MNIIKCIGLDLNEAESRQIVNVKENDAGRTLVINISQSGRPYFVGEELRAMIAGTRPDGYTFLNDARIEDGRIFYELTELNTSAVGVANAELRLYGPEDELIASPTFAIKVSASAMDDGEVLESAEATALTQLIQEAQTAIEEMEAAAITAAEVSINNEVGTPAASVELLQTDHGQTLRLSLENLKGDKGETGATGATGPAGPQGIQGETGATGPVGPQGIQGIQGPIGPIGPTGPQGETGATGATGPQGNAIYVVQASSTADTVAFPPSWVESGGKELLIGDLLIASYNGRLYRVDMFMDNGDIGAVYTGINLRGPQGERGIQGEKGDTGPQGETGATGPQGETGPAGADGKSIFMLRASPDSDLIGALFSMIDNGDRPIQKGDLLVSSTNGRVYSVIAVDSVQVTAEYTGLTVKGEKGATGATGPQGETGPAGADGISPTIDVSKTDGVTTLTITDAEGTKTAEILDGEGGTDVLNDKGIIKQEHLPEGFPYLEDGGFTVLLPETAWEGEGQVVLPDTTAAPLVIGNSYTISWNGTDYVCECVDASVIDAPPSAWVMGNYGATTGGTDTGEPFIIMVLPSELVEEAGFGAMIGPLDGSTTGTVSISEGSQTITPIAQKYLPEGFPYSEMGISYILPTTILSYDENLDGFAVSSGIDASMFIEGESYTVNWNGTDYPTQAVAVEDGGLVGIVLGDYGMMESGTPVTGEPFVIVILPLEVQEQMGVAAMLSPLDGSESITLSISGTTEVNTVIAQKYLPEGYPYKEVVTGVIVSETTVNSFNSVALDMDNLLVGETYTVKIGDTEYSTLCKSGVFGDLGTVSYLGNAGSLGGTDTGEPFYIIPSDDEGYAIIAFAGSSPSTVTISGPYTLWHEIDPRYLPKKTDSDVLVYITDLDITRVNPTFDELVLAIKSGKIVSHRYGSGSDFDEFHFNNLYVDQIEFEHIELSDSLDITIMRRIFHSDGSWTTRQVQIATTTEA